MNIDNAKENIQPLASGRNITLLEAALHAENHQDAHRELMQKREEFERRIAEYVGDDPLELWYDYILWIEQCYPKSGKQSAFDNVLVKCITTLENDERYHQDRRMVKIYIKFIDSQQTPHEHYNTLYNQGIGTMVADMYICWAYYFEVLENFQRAEQIYQLGFDARAQPLDELKQAHEQFLSSVGQRTLYSDERTRQTFFSNMEERRSALTSLRGHQSSRVGSIRTGGVVRDLNPGRVDQLPASNSRTPYQAATPAGIAIYVDEQETFNGPPEAGTSSGIRSIVGSAGKQENQWEPGPWTKAKKRTQSSALFPTGSRSAAKLDFDIMEDSDDLSDAIRLPENFVRYNAPQPNWMVSVAQHEDLAARVFPLYDKILCYPKGGLVVFSPEELRAFNWYRNRGMRAKITAELEDFVENRFEQGVRLPENFRQRSEKQDEFVVESAEVKLLPNEKLMCCAEAIGDHEEVSFEEMRRVKFQRVRMEKQRHTNEFCPPQPPQPMPSINDSCSTQTFNFFIKPQSVSTPKQDLKKPIHTPRSSLPLNQQQQQQQQCDVKQPEVAVAETKTTQQLSTIWETTEPSTTTFWSRGSTKSSTSSNDSPDNLLTRRQQVTTTQALHGAISSLDYHDVRSTPIAVYKDHTDSVLATSKKPTLPMDNYYDDFLQSPQAGKKTFNSSKISPRRGNDSFTFPSMHPMAVSGMTSSIYAKHDPDAVAETSKIGGSVKREVRLVSGNGSGAAGPMFSESTRLSHSHNGQSLSKLPERLGIATARGAVEEDDDVVFVPMQQYSVGDLYTSRSYNAPPVPKVPKILDVHSVREQSQFARHELSVLKEDDASFTFPPNNLHEMSTSTRKDIFGKVEQVKREPPSLGDSRTVHHIDNVWLPEAKEWSVRKDERKSHIVSHVSESDPLRMTISMRDGSRNASVVNNSLYKNQSPQYNKPTKIARQDFMSNGNDSDQSIYMNNSVNGVINPEDDWSEDDNQPVSSYQRKEIDMNETLQVIDHNLGQEVVNPFNPNLINAFLEKADFMNYLDSLESCTLTNIVKMIKPNSVIEMNGHTLDVGKLLGSGTFGKVYHAKCQVTGNCYALKQERPANLWEYYIVLELKDRMNEMDQSLMSAFVDVEFAMIGNNASILALPLCRYGTLLNVCNFHKKTTDKCLHEFIVIMLTTQMLSIIDYLHACNIIHADIKPDNFMLTSKLNYDSPYSALKLIDFGQSIDMKLFPENTTFKYVVKTEGFTCTEMLENRPWTYQTDLFGVAATIHVLLFGKYMNVSKSYNGWTMTHKLPRYFQKAMWERIFSMLLNIRDCQSMPNLQDMKLMLKKELAMKESAVRDQIIKFNSVLDNYKPGL
ncbi:uncharacterized protein LOC132264084 [Phlebotomus argentipes]|uniref:uncharacterized protein LOC132264084 n=1 Tax=Phlebotomus argentipes TaxID=94469 RepID=UPI002892F4FD|nr:uncharacterized protein LOC132264084 [Phlebotomus argentipes]